MDEKKDILQIRVQPRAAKNEISGWKGEALYVRLTAPPVDGAANKAIVEFIAEQLNVKRHQIRLISGDKSRDKTLEVEGLSQDEIFMRLGKGADAEEGQAGK